MAIPIILLFLLLVSVPNLILPIPIDSGSIHKIFFSDKWKALYNLYNETCGDDYPMKVMTWTKECVYMCDDNGDPLFLSRKKTLSDIGLGSVALKYGNGGTRSPDDNNVYLGDDCTNPESLMYFQYDRDRRDTYALVCNETNQVEFLSLRFSRCYTDYEYEFIKRLPSVKVEGGACVIQYKNVTVMDLGHNEFAKTSQPLTGMCWFHYCCDGIHHTSTEDCSMDDFCDREIS